MPNGAEPVAETQNYILTKSHRWNQVRISRTAN